MRQISLYVITTWCVWRHLVRLVYIDHEVGAAQGAGRARFGDHPNAPVGAVLKSKYSYASWRGLCCISFKVRLTA